MPLSKKNKIFTYEDYQAWPDDEHWEIIDGSAYLMAPPSRIHQEISRELLTSFSVYLKDKPCRVYSAPFSVRFPSDDEKRDEDIKTVVEPDISVICDESKLDDKGCKGSPRFDYRNCLTNISKERQGGKVQSVRKMRCKRILAG